MSSFSAAAPDPEGNQGLAYLVAAGRLPEPLQRALITRTYEAGEILHHSGEPSQGIHIVRSGRIRLARYTNEGQLLTFQFVKPQGSFGEWDLFSGVASSSAISEVSSQVMLLPRTELLALHRQSSSLTQAIIHQLIQTVQQLKGRLELREIRSARHRVLHYLQWIATPDQRQIAFEMPLKDVATELGLTPESFYRTLAQLEREGLITRYPGGLSFQDLPSG